MDAAHSEAAHPAGPEGGGPEGCALVTGATGGIGGAIARALAEAGVRVLVTGRDEARAAELAAALEDATGTRCIGAELDVTKPDSVAALEEAAAPIGPVEWLINNAGIADSAPALAPENDSKLRRMMEVNFHGPLRLFARFGPGMVERGRGHIVNMSSVAASYPYPGGNVYGATKAFVRQFSLNLRSDLLGTPVKVTSVEPGMCETEFSQVRFRGDAEAAAMAYAFGAEFQTSFYGLLAAERASLPMDPA
ncbi:MAG: SDR family NAD(P)-dependent oxidoreductase, partial [Planctomycetota bacterium]